MDGVLRGRISFWAGACAAAALTAGALIATTAEAAIGVGQAAPNFEEIDSNGVTHSLSDFAGKTLILEWTNHGCPFVQKHYSGAADGNMQTLQAAIADDPDTVWVSVISSAEGKQGYVSPAEANELTNSRGAAPDAVLLDVDGSMGRAFDAKTTPHMYVITPDGAVAYQGAIDSKKSTDPSDIPESTNYLTAALTALDAGQAPDPAATMPYGCSVKY